MSVLFRALRVAAREYQQRKSPVFVPILPPSKPTARPLHRWVWVAVPFLSAFLLGVLIFAWGSGEGAVAAPQATIETTEEKVVKPGRIRLEKSAPDGIALPIESLMVEEGKAGGAAKEIEKQIKDAPALKKAAPKKTKEASSTKKAPAKSSKKAAITIKKAAPQTATQMAEDVEDKAPTSLATQAHALLEEGNYADALDVYNDILSKNPKDSVGLTGKAYILEQSGVAAALPQLEALAKANPKIGAVQASFARLLSREGQKAEALEAWKKAAALEPSNDIYRLSLAILYDRNGYEAEALKLYTQTPEPVPSEIQNRIAYLMAKGTR